MRLVMICFWMLTWSQVSQAEQRFESFDRDPGWDAHHNRSMRPETIQQDFGYSRDTAHAGAARGEVGGTIQPAAEAAYFALPVTGLNLQTPFSASGKLLVEQGGGHFLLGFFNDRTLNEWRTPNTAAFRILQRGDIFYCYPEYCSPKWRAASGVVGTYNADTDRFAEMELPADATYTWSLAYDPEADGGNGRFIAHFGKYEIATALDPKIKEDGATFNRFGLLPVMKQWDNAGKAWIDDVTVQGRFFDFAEAATGWTGLHNRTTYETRIVRPRFDFGWSNTAYAGGHAAGELGGLFFRGDCRYPEKLAHYGARVEELSLRQPLRASGKVALRRGVSDSTTLFGFYHAVNSLRVNPEQNNATPCQVLGINIEGPSAEGFYFYPVLRGAGDTLYPRGYHGAPRIYPDGTSHAWTLEYLPANGDTPARLAVTLDDQRVEQEVPAAILAENVVFDHFGLVTPWIDGNGQTVYFDDIDYTVRQEQ
ncbi:MAG: hypothetical protein ACYC4U_11725 [Pirellulaceae bacterium]